MTAITMNDLYSFITTLFTGILIGVHLGFVIASWAFEENKYNRQLRIATSVRSQPNKEFLSENRYLEYLFLTRPRTYAM